MKTQIGLVEKNVVAVVAELSKILADEYVLYTKTRNAHWNIIGPDFYYKHKLFEKQYAQIEVIIDDVAERIRMIGHFAPATLKDFLELTRLSETMKEKNDGITFVKELVADHETIIIKLREAIPEFGEKYNDAGSCDYITGLMKEHEKMAWFLRSHV